MGLASGRSQDDKGVIVKQGCFLIGGEVLVRVCIRKFSKGFGRIELKTYVRVEFYNLRHRCPGRQITYNNWMFNLGELLSPHTTLCVGGWPGRLIVGSNMCYEV